jgi:hypothetical protein
MGPRRSSLILDRWVGRLLMATALGHAVVGLVLFHAPLADIVRDGVVGAIGPRGSGGALTLAFDREAAFWFLLFSPMLFLVGQITSRAAEAGDGPLLRLVGWSLVGNGIVGVVLMPISGHWIVAALGILVLRVAARATALEAPALATARAAGT